MSEPIHEQVKRIEERAENLERIAGEILVSLRVNLRRETLTTKDNAQFERMLDSWERQVRMA